MIQASIHICDITVIGSILAITGLIVWQSLQIRHRKKDDYYHKFSLSSCDLPIQENKENNFYRQKKRKRKKKRHKNVTTKTQCSHLQQQFIKFHMKLFSIFPCFVVKCLSGSFFFFTFLPWCLSLNGLICVWKYHTFMSTTWLEP